MVSVAQQPRQGSMERLDPDTHSYLAGEIGEVDPDITPRASTINLHQESMAAEYAKQVGAGYNDHRDRPVTRHGYPSLPLSTHHFASPPACARTTSNSRPIPPLQPAPTAQLPPVPRVPFPSNEAKWYIVVPQNMRDLPGLFNSRSAHSQALHHAKLSADATLQ